MKRSLRISLFIFLTAILFLFAPKPAGNKYCGTYFRINKAMGFLINCDSHQYILLSMHPSNLLSKDSVARRQNRPLYIALTYAIGKPIEYVLFAVYNGNENVKLKLDKLLNSDKLLKRLELSSFEKQDKYTTAANNATLILQMIAFFISYVLLNFLLLVLSVYLFEVMLEQFQIQQKIIYLLSVVLIANTIVKDFIYSAHEQMFLFLTPISIVYALHHYIYKKQNRKTYWLTFLFGLGCLAYGSFILYLPALWLLLFYQDKSIKTIYASRVNYIIHAILFLFPTLTWIFICKQISGQYYNHEVANFRELVWVIDALKIGLAALVKVFVFNLTHFLLIFTKAVFPFLLIYFVLWKANKPFKNSEKYDSLITVLVSCFIVFTAFFALLGYYAYRLSFSSSVLVLIGIAAQFQMLLENKPQLTNYYYKRLYAAVILWCILVFIL
ncbi:MAG TPA: hypothetical protein PLK15_07650 [Chitinophagales bacterium]|jgi:hypothetical protein|nr:hypothetical protein [Chitinophagales bacterium]